MHFLFATTIPLCCTWELIVSSHIFLMPALMSNHRSPFQVVCIRWTDHICCLWTGGSQVILLQTARTNVFNAVRIIFDSGTQHSYMYVREQIAVRLSLTTEAKRPLTIITFGSTRKQGHICGLVRLGLATRDGTTKHLMLFTVPKICKPITCQLISICWSNFDHLARVDLADSLNGCGSLEVDFLMELTSTGRWSQWRRDVGALAPWPFPRSWSGFCQAPLCLYWSWCSCFLPQHTYSTCW